MLLIKGLDDIAYAFSHSYARIKIDSYDSLSLRKSMTLHKVIILIKSVLDKDQNHYFYNMFLEKVGISYLKITTMNKVSYKLQMLYYDTTASKECTTIGIIGVSLFVTIDIF